MTYCSMKTGYMTDAERLAIDRYYAWRALMDKTYGAIYYAPSKQGTI